MQALERLAAVLHRTAPPRPSRMRGPANVPLKSLSWATGEFREELKAGGPQLPAVQRACP